MAKSVEDAVDYARTAGAAIYDGVVFMSRKDYADVIKAAAVVADAVSNLEQFLEEAAKAVTAAVPNLEQLLEDV